jgi:hypothetical protein
MRFPEFLAPALFRRLLLAIRTPLFVRRLPAGYGDLQPALMVGLPFPQGRIPDLDLPFAAVAAGGSEAPPVGVEGNTGDVTGVCRTSSYA